MWRGGKGKLTVSDNFICKLYKGVNLFHGNKAIYLALSSWLCLLLSASVLSTPLFIVFLLTAIHNVCRFKH